MDNNALKIFSNEMFGNVRTLVGDNGESLFCGTDIAKALKYTNPRKAIRDHCHGGAKRSIGVTTGIHTDGSPALQSTEMTFIPEGDVYRLIIRSNMPEAVKFEKWIMECVVPSIRKRGTYFTPSMLEEVINNSDKLILLAQALKDEQRQRGIT